MGTRVIGSEFRLCLLISLLFLATLSPLGIIGLSIGTSPALDLQIATDKRIYNAGDSVTITGNVTLDGVVQNSTLVGVEVDDPFGKPYLIRTVDSGNVSSQSWNVEIVDLYTCDGQSNPQTVFSRGTRDAYLDMTVRSNSPVNAYHIVGGAYVQSSNDTALQAFFPFETNIGANATAKFLQYFSIPDDAPTGQARLFASVFSDLPVNGGYPLCPERSINFSVESSTPQIPQQPQHFNVTFDFPLTDVIAGHYAVYGNVYYQLNLVSKMILFTLGPSATFAQTGVGSDYSDTVVVIDGANYTRADLPVSFNWDIGSNHSFAYQSPIVVAADGKRYLWYSTSGPVPLQNGNINVTSLQTITGNYKTQYYMADSSSFDSPGPTSNWFDDNTPIGVHVTSIVSGPTGTRHVCTGWSGTGNVPSNGTGSSTVFIIDQPSSITWNWKTQYLLKVSATPTGFVPQLSQIPTGEGASANSWWYDSSTGVTLTAGTVENYTFNYWSVDGVSQGQGVNPVPVTMNTPHAAIAHYISSSAAEIAVLDLTVSKTIVGQGYTLVGNATVENCGTSTESFNLTIFANSTILGTFTNLTLPSGEYALISFLWNATEFAYGNYTISAYAEPVPGETYILDNNYTCPIPVHVGVPGDVSGTTLGVYDGTVNVRDIAYMIMLFNTKPGSPNWNPNADVNDDGVCNMKDIAIAIVNFNKHE